jgi:hypothetical protein
MSKGNECLKTTKQIEPPLRIAILRAMAPVSMAEINAGRNDSLEM